MYDERKRQDNEKQLILGQIRKKVKADRAKICRAVQQAQTAARRDLIKEIAQLDLRDRLLYVALDDERALPFYPAELIEGTYGGLDPAGLWAVSRIAEKAKKIPRGPWKKWLTNLRESNN